jgi:predicted nucleotidyltransferase
MKKNRTNSCRTSIIKTLAYSGVFGYPVTFYQISNNLISGKLFTYKKIRKELEKLIDEGVVKKVKNRFMLKGIRTHNVSKREKYTREIIEKHKEKIKLLKKVPWIKMIAITGSVANYDAEENDDIDLLIVTEKNRLWITRGFVFLILKIINELPKDKSKRKICPNIFLDESNMAWSDKKRNLYVAQNVISMQPFSWRDDTYFKFINENNWVKKYYKNFNVDYQDKKIKTKKDSPLMVFLEKVARKEEIKYMEKDITTEVVNSKLIHFNKNDSTKRILSKYKEILKKYQK